MAHLSIFATLQGSGSANRLRQLRCVGGLPGRVRGSGEVEVGGEVWAQIEGGGMGEEREGEEGVGGAQEKGEGERSRGGEVKEDVMKELRVGEGNAGLGGDAS